MKLHVVTNLCVLIRSGIYTVHIHLLFQYCYYMHTHRPEKMAAEVVERSWWSTNSRACPEDCIVIALHSLLLSRKFTCTSLSDEVSLVFLRNADAYDVICSHYISVWVHNLM